MAALCEEEIDPRIKEELEKLNSATDQINSLELRLDEARASFRQALTESTHSLNAISKRIGSVIEKARPYYEARQKAKEIQQETQRAALRFERACSMLTAAKEMVDLAEQGLFQDGRTFDANWQEMLNHATMKVGEAENERALSVHEHLSTAAKFNEAEREVKRLQRSLRSSISKSRPYFEMKVTFNQNLEIRKKMVSELEKDVSAAKQVYSNALRKLEQISDQIHEQRRSSAAKLGQRESGVGAEAPAIIQECPSPRQLNIDEEVDRLDQVIKQHKEGTTPKQQRSRDDLDLSPGKTYPLPQRPVSYTAPSSTGPDPHSILMSYESTEHLDDISDTISCQSEPVLDLDDEGSDSGLDTLASRTASSLTFAIEYAAYEQEQTAQSSEASADRQVDGERAGSASDSIGGSEGSEGGDCTEKVGDVGEMTSQVADGGEGTAGGTREDRVTQSPEEEESGKDSTPRGQDGDASGHEQVEVGESTDGNISETPRSQASESVETKEEAEEDQLFVEEEETFV
ncbi:uncharacterized protein [Diadema antillarum]|uniref:uncharacterized protein n=1 Tax=Diadema antillarum TaxID=105358 RepID=UPI003A8484CA